MTGTAHEQKERARGSLTGMARNTDPSQHVYTNISSLVLCYSKINIQIYRSAGVHMKVRQTHYTKSKY